MRSIDRVLGAIERKKIDHPPFDLGEGLTGLTLEAYKKFSQYLDIPADHRGVSRITTTVKPNKKFLKTIGGDIREISPNPPPEGATEELPGNKYRDEWGIVRKKSGAGYYDILEDEAPLKDLEDPAALSDYDWPEVFQSRFSGLEHEAKKLSEKGYALKGGCCAGIFEMSFWLRGWVNQYKDLAGNKERASAVMRSLLEVQKEFWDGFLAEAGDYLNIVQLTEDLGMQDQLMVSPETFREIVEPKIAELISFIKNRAPSVYVMLHSDGAVRPLIDDFIDMGVDILNPLQPNAKGMDAAGIKREFGKDLCFHGAIDIQDVLPFKDPDEVKQYVNKQKRILGGGGGYIVAPAHAVQPEVPPENLQAFIESARTPVKRRNKS